MNSDCMFGGEGGGVVREKAAPNYAENVLGYTIPKIFSRSLLYLSAKNDASANAAKPTKPLPHNNSAPESNLHETYKHQQRLLELQNQLGMIIVQKNGQRKLSGPPPGWMGPPPGTPCEVFVGNIPRKIFEDTLYPIFRQVGEIYEMRLMVDFSGDNRGFGYVMYTKPEYAHAAIRKLNMYPIGEGRRLGVVRSRDNCRLFLAKLPSSIEAKAFMEKILPLTEDIDEISVFTKLRDHPQIKHALITFKSHAAAAATRRSLLHAGNSFFGTDGVRITWARPDISLTNVLQETGRNDGRGKLLMIQSKVIPKDDQAYDISKRPAMMMIPAVGSDDNRPERDDKNNSSNLSITNDPTNFNQNLNYPMPSASVAIHGTNNNYKITRNARPILGRCTFSSQL